MYIIICSGIAGIGEDNSLELAFINIYIRIYLYLYIYTYTCIFF